MLWGLLKNRVYVSHSKLLDYILWNEELDPYPIDYSMSLFMRFCEEGVWNEKLPADPYYMDYGTDVRVHPGPNQKIRDTPLSRNPKL